MIRLILLNLLIAVIYVALSGNADGLNVVLGIGVGFLVLTIFGLVRGANTYGGRSIRLIRFVIYFLTILTKANFQIAREILTPGLGQTPRILRYPVQHLSAVELTTLANCITLTPGTLVVDVSDDNDWLYVHCMYAHDRQKAIAELDELAERLHREIFTK